MTKKIFKAFAFLLLAFSVVGLSSCNDSKEVEDVTATCKLTRSAKNKTFAENGIEECTIVRYTDGDTSTIKGVNSGATYTIRYLSIDTPESTAGYDKWGKAASVWNKELLSAADSWVVEAEGSTPELDSNGTRYLGYIWYRLPGEESYRLYNLECVENGYSANNCATTGKYYSYFEQAETKAKKQKLHLFGDEDDIYFPEEINNISLKELNANPSKYYNAETSVPTCVSFEAYIVNVPTDSFRTVTVEQFDKTDGKYYQYKVVIGYSGSRLYTIAKANTLMRFIGWTTGEGSIHGCTALAGAKEDSYYTISRQQNYYNNLTVKVETAVVANGVMTITGTSTINKETVNVTLTLEDSSVTAEQAQGFVGKTVKAKAFAKEKNNVENYSLNCLGDISL